MIEINNVSKWFGTFQVLDTINETIEKGQVVVICGPSGSGKSTILKCLNGLERFQEGDIIVDGLSLKDPSTDLFKLRQKMGMVFQRFELYPHLKVIENINIAPIKVKKVPEKDAVKRAMELLERVGIPDQADKYPGNLSGGQQQRVAIARALAMDPEIMLFDEPTSALDVTVQLQVLAILDDLVSERGMGLIFISHDLHEAMRIGDRIAMMEGGRIVQVGTPDGLYECSFAVNVAGGMLAWVAAGFDTVSGGPSDAGTRG